MPTVAKPWGLMATPPLGNCHIRHSNPRNFMLCNSLVYVNQFPITRDEMPEVTSL